MAQAGNSVDILHPRAKLEWSSVSEFPDESIDKINPSIAIFKNNVYMEIYFHTAHDARKSLSTLWRYGEWRNRPHVPVSKFGFTTFRSQLVLVGGLELATGMVTDKLWSSDDGTNWHEMLPPMRVGRIYSSAVSVGDPECLVVAGGSTRDDSETDSKIGDVEVLLNDQWFMVQPLPVPTTPDSCVHYGTLFFDCTAKLCCCCSVDELLQSCSDEKGKVDLWKEVTLIDSSYVICSFGQRMVAMEYSGRTSINVLDPATLSWVSAHEFEVPGDWQFEHISIFPNGDLVTIATDDEWNGVEIGATLKFASYNLEDYISIHVIRRMELAGIPLLQSLVDHLDKFKEIVGINPEDLSLEASVEDTLTYWCDDDYSSREMKRPTWGSLLEILEELGLKELSLDIQDCLINVLTLKETCMNVIMSNLLQQLNLNADQLQDMLPDYVPTTLRKAIVHSYKAHVIPLHLLPSVGQSTPSAGGESSSVPERKKLHIE